MWQTGRATLQELETHWSIDDVFKGNLLLDLEEASQQKAEKIARRKTK